MTSLRIERGDSPWKMAKKSLKEQGQQITNAAIAEEMLRLAKVNGFSSVDEFKSKFRSVGGEVVLGDTSASSKSSKGTKSSGNTGSSGSVRVGSDDDDDSVFNPGGRVKGSDNAPEIVINSVDRIKKAIKEKGHSSASADVSQLSADKQKQVTQYSSFYGVSPSIIKDTANNEFHVFFDVENTPKGKDVGLQSMEIVISADGSTKINRHFTNGKIVQDIPNEKEPKKSRSVLIQGPVKKEPKTTKKIKEALDIDIEIDPKLLEGASSGQRKEVQDFVNTLKNQKASLMKDLNIDNDTYNKFVKMAIGIAMQETKLGTADSYKYWDDRFYGIALKDSIGAVNSGLSKIGIKNPLRHIKSGLGSTSTSKGLTQIKIGDWNDDPKIDKLFKKYSIGSGYYDSLSGSQSAAATMIVLNELSKKVKSSQAIKDGIEAANGKHHLDDYDLVNGEVVKGDKWKTTKMTEEDAMLYLYNGRAVTLKNGNATPESNIYTHNVNRFMQGVRIKEDPAKRAEALKHAIVETEGGPKRKKLQTDLGGGIGQVAFQPKLYTGGVTNNSDDEISNLENLLTAKGIHADKVKKLTNMMKNGELAFVKGLTKSELDSITAEDVDLIIKYSNKLKTKLQNVSSAAEKRKIATAIDKEFKQEYLASHAQYTSLSSVQKSTVKLSNPANSNVKAYPKNGYYTGAQNRCKKYLPQLRGNHTVGAGPAAADQRVRNGMYTGFRAEKDKGINYNNASKIDILLAQNGADAANTLQTGGACLTGTKQALIGAGAVTAEEMATFNEAHQLADFLAKHPERFIEITHIQVDDKTARELTAGDLSSLPAGCIVIFGNSNFGSHVPGHAAITSGNGQMYADEVDNSNWDNFTANSKNQDGKGEHGFVRVFKLNPAYFDTDINGKKLIKK